MADKKQNEQELQQEQTPAPALPYEMHIEGFAPKKKRSKGKIIGLAIAIIVVLAIVINMVLGAIKGPAPTYVQVQPAQIGTVQQSLNTTGTLTTGQKVTVYSLVSAPLTEINVVLGGSVQAGQPLFAYDTTDLERSYRQASANSGLSSLQAQAAAEASDESQQTANEYTNSINNLKEQQGIAQNIIEELTPQIAALQAQIDALQASMEGLIEGTPEFIAAQQKLAELNAQLAPLAQNLAAQQQDYAANKAILSQLDGMESTAKKGVMTENGKKQSQLSQVPSAVALEMARENLNLGLEGVSAPMNGVVTSLSASKGTLASQYSPLCVIESLDKVDVVVQLSRYDLERVKVGQSATITTLGKQYSGTVTQIDAMATQGVSGSTTSSVVRAKVSITNPDTSIVLGLEASVEIATGEAANVVIIPISAANTDVDGTYCFIVENGVAHRRTITLGLSSDTMVEVTEGLQEGDEVILASQNIIEGANVSTDPANAPAENTGMVGMMVG
ncbi:efflux RND transporter periplasmic adaptor subunit [Ruminococcaceae bacterium OttesenSCG-928-A16]|nr:efflux RND transporter periplasmic adaptor subunit [Ruminococcaceae bacterium OttesenSCG-928-A16]